jgi:hypothetical protein
MISNFITNNIYTSIKPANIIQRKVKYLNEIELEIPEWYLTHQGHDLEVKLKTVFKPLNKFQNESELKKEIIKKVVDDIPELIPLDILELFQSIQST